MNQASIRRQFSIFLLRWVMNSVGMWIAVRLLGNTDGATASTYVLAGLAFSLVNSLLRPVVMILALPAILLTLGMFTLVVNGFMVYIALLLMPLLSMSFFNSIIAGVILSLVNYVVSSALDLRVAQKE